MKIRTSFMIVTMAWLTLSANGTEVKPRPKFGLTVQQGQLLLQGEPYQGMGANYFDLFSRRLKDSSDLSYQKGLERLSKGGIPFVRFMACGFWPADWDLYLNDKDAYFRLFDGIVRCAETNQIGLIPSLFWHMSTLPDIVGEPIDQYGNPSSKTIAFVRQYTKEVVLRYKDSPAIWGWEFGNEYNLHVDLPDPSKHRPPVWPSLKTALVRTDRDDLSSRAMQTALAEFAKTVRQYDKHRILLTGNSVPRPNAYHNSKKKSWERDSIEQFEEILLRDNPDQFPLICVHLYPKPDKRYSAHVNELPDLIMAIQRIALQAKKPLFIGEFGASSTLGEKEERTKFLELVTAIEANKVPLSALWVFDHSRQNKDWNTTFENKRHYMLNLVAEANERMKANAKSSHSTKPRAL